MPEQPKRILIIRPSALGDVARTVPLAASLRRALPEARIDWLVQDGFSALIEPHPAVDEVIAFPRQHLGANLKKLRAGPLLGFIAGLRGRRYDWVIDAQGLFRSGFIAAATGSRVRVGDYDAREGASVFYTHAPRIAERHTVDRMLALLEPLGVPKRTDMRLYLSPTRASAAPDAGAATVIAPTSRWPAKRWPAERFADVARRLLADSPRPIVIVGGPGEASQCGPLLELAAADPRVTNLVGRTDVAGLARTIAGAGLVIACDSAAAHIAVGFDRPLVALYGPTEIDRVGPYRREADVIQHLTPSDTLDHKDASNARLMSRITVEQVVAAARYRLEQPVTRVC